MKTRRPVKHYDKPMKFTDPIETCASLFPAGLLFEGLSYAKLSPGWCVATVAPVHITHVCDELQSNLPPCGLT